MGRQISQVFTLSELGALEGWWAEKGWEPWRVVGREGTGSYPGAQGPSGGHKWDWEGDARSGQIMTVSRCLVPGQRQQSGRC